MPMWKVVHAITGTYVVGDGVTRFYFDSAGGTAQQAATAATAFWTGVRDLVHTSTTFTLQTEVVEINEATGFPMGVDTVSSASVTGNASEDPMSGLNQMCVNWRTGTYILGRERRGRTFIPALTEGDWTSGVWVSGRLTLVTTAISNLIAAATAQLVVYSPTQHDMYEVTAGGVKTKMSYLRSRRD